MKRDAKQLILVGILLFFTATSGRAFASEMLKIGITGCDTSHVSASTKVLNNNTDDNNTDDNNNTTGHAAESAAPLSTTRTKSRPNIVFLLADDLGYGDLACYGCPDTRTPQLDQLAREGVRFTAHYANGAECTPTRAALLTGRYQQWIGGLECAIGIGNVGRYDDAIRLVQSHDLGLPTTESTISQLLKAAGYDTALFGKWHLGYEPKFAPHLHGFDEALYCIGGGMDYFHYTDSLGAYNLHRNGKQIEADGYYTDVTTDEAVRFIARDRERPFFLYVPFTTPHAPFQGPTDRQPEPLTGKSPRWKQGEAPHDVYVAMNERMDESVGRILNALKDRGIAENTVVIFTSDNGGTGSARNTPFSNIKGTTFEGGIRVPAIVRWPAKVPAGVVSDQPCLTFDFTAAIANLADTRPPVEKPFEGIDIVSHVAEQRPDFTRTLYWRKQRGEEVWIGVREGALKLVAREQGGQRAEEHLFHLLEDPSEQHDLKTEQPNHFERLKSLYQAWEKTTRENRRGRPESSTELE